MIVMWLFWPPPLSSTAAFVASIVVWHENDRLHLSEPVDRVVLYFHVSVHNNIYIATCTCTCMCDDLYLKVETNWVMRVKLITGAVIVLLDACYVIHLSSLFLQAIFSPLQGFLNAIVYGWSRREFRRAVANRERVRFTRSHDHGSRYDTLGRHAVSGQGSFLRVNASANQSS